MAKKRKTFLKFTTQKPKYCATLIGDSNLTVYNNNMTPQKVNYT